MIAFWNERRAWILIVGIVLALNTAFFFTYRVRYEERVDEAHARLESVKEQLSIAKGRRIEYEQQLEAHKSMVATIATVYDTWWSTPEERMTKLITEVRSLVEKSGLSLQSVNYSRGEVNEESSTTTVDIAFGVDGRYLQLRQLINMLELSEQFVIIDAVSFSGSQPDGTIGLQLRLRTIFKGEQKISRTKVDR